ncbi:MAG: hypothetical protein H6Q15_1947 [Bacteroidetes bacterium]|nr:hypothetical protein [Bacteroidota bacterium]
MHSDMNAIIGKIKDEFSGLRKNIEYTEKLKNSSGLMKEDLEYFRSLPKRILDYKTIIISLYGILENSIDKLCAEYLECLEKRILEYDFLSDIFRDNHFNYSIELINKILEKRHKKYDNIDKFDVLTNLYICIKQNEGYKINKYAFNINTGNIGHKKICDIFSLVDINIRAELGKRNSPSKNSELSYEWIENLVERRNNVAHGNEVEIMNYTALNPMIDFIEKYLIDIAEILNDNLSKLVFAYSFNKSAKLNVCKTYPTDIIEIEDGKDLNLSMQDKVLIKQPSGFFFTANIIDMRECENNNITIRLNKNIRNNFEFCIC